MVKRRKSKVVPPPQGCPLRACMRMLGGAWTAEVIWFLREGERCFSELQMDLAGVSAKVLTGALRKLEREGVIERRERATSPPTVWYGLTEGGKRLSAALEQVAEAAQGLHASGSEVT